MHGRSTPPKSKLFIALEELKQLSDRSKIVAQHVSAAIPGAGSTRMSISSAALPYARPSFNRAAELEKAKQREEAAKKEAKRREEQAEAERVRKARHQAKEVKGERKALFPALGAGEARGDRRRRRPQGTLRPAGRRWRERGARVSLKASLAGAAAPLTPSATCLSCTCIFTTFFPQQRLHRLGF